MAGPSAIDWMQAFDRSAMEGVKPLLDYNEMQRRLALHRQLRDEQLSDEQRIYNRNRQDRLADVAETERFTTEQNMIAARRQEERDIREQNFRRDMEDAATQRAIDMRAMEWDHADRVQKETMLRELKAKADKLGIPAPSHSDFETAFSYYNKEVNAAESKGLMDLVKQGISLHQQVSQLTGSTEQERAGMQMAILLGGNYADATKVLTPAEKLALQKDPGAIIAIQDRLARDKSSKGRKAFDAFDQALNDSEAQATALYAKRSTQNKEQLEVVKGLMAEHRAMVSSRFKDAVLGPDTITGMFSGIMDEMKARQAPPPPPPTQRPPPTAILSTPPATAPSASADQFQGLIPMAGSAISSTLGAAADFARPVVGAAGIAAGDVGTALFGGRFRNPAEAFFRGVTQPTFVPRFQPYAAFQGQVIPPQLQQYLQQQALQQNAIAPTAFPPLPLAGTPDYRGVVGMEP